MKPVILIHESEMKNVFVDHATMAKAALPTWEVAIWKDRPPDLTGRAVLKVGNSFYLGTERFEALADALGRAAQVFVAINDYTSPPPTQVRDALRPIRDRVAVLTTIDPTVLKVRTAGRRMWDWFTDVAVVDWNKASWKQEPVEPDDSGTLVYWGALRPARVPSFKRFLVEAPYPVVLSGALRSKGAWAELAPNATWAGRLSIDEAARYDATIYLEDENQHHEFHSVASRFYEAIGRGQFMLIDRECKGTFDHAGLNVYDWTVRDAEEVRMFLKNAPRHRARQQAKLVQNYFAIGAKQLKQVMRRYVK